MALDSVLDYGTKVTPLQHSWKGGNGMSTNKAETGSLVTSSIAAVFASACCAGPLILISLGLGGAWVSNLTALEPYRWLFVGVAVAALVFAWRKIYRPVEQCEPAQACAVPQARRAYKIAFWSVVVLVVAAISSPYVAWLFVRG